LGGTLTLDAVTIREAGDPVAGVGFFAERGHGDVTM
jgi:hypothetical protein